MASVDPKILRKIKKCLALSGSDNQNEAATALRQARALMNEHGVTSHQVTMADVGEASAQSRTMARDKPSRWEVVLAAMVGRAFGCQMMIGRSVYASSRKGYANDGKFIFVGSKNNVDVAAYTAEVLSKKCKMMRQKWLKETHGGVGRGVLGSKSKLTRMGDMFAEGWVASVDRLIFDFANPPEMEAAIARHIEAQSSGAEAPVRGVRKMGGEADRRAAMAGMRAAQDERLYRPMEGGADRVSLPYV